MRPGPLPLRRECRLKGRPMEALKQALWDRWGSKEFPAEWDGVKYGGGKGSQRYWEYLWVVDQLKGNERRILDVGAGQTLFLPRLLRLSFPHVEAVDPEVPAEDALHHRVELGAWLSDNPRAADSFDCVTCVSVLEHLQDSRVLFGQLARFARARIIITLELGFEPPGFEYQLTMREIYAGLACFGAHYLSKMETCPVCADNSKGGYWRPFGLVLAPRNSK
jgi:2-polyprenyl-3-methyl-5-hydroxy-6-metoxy-1,4-benzoquinol methylase